MLASCTAATEQTYCSSREEVSRSAVSRKHTKWRANQHVMLTDAVFFVSKYGHAGPLAGVGDGGVGVGESSQPGGHGP